MPLDLNLLKNKLSELRRNAYFYYLIAALVICFGFALRLIALDKGLFCDEIWTIKYAKSSTFINDVRYDQHPPLYFIILHFWAKISVDAEFLRILSVFFNVGMIAIVVRWISRYSRFAGILSGIYCALLPLFLIHSQQIRHYSLLTLFTAASFLFAYLASQSPRKISNYIWMSLSLSFSIMTHLVGVMLVLSVFAYMALISRDYKKYRIAFIFGAFLVPILVFFGVFCFYMVGTSSRNPNHLWFPHISLSYVLGLAQNLTGTDYLIKNAGNLFPAVGYKSLIKHMTSILLVVVLIRLITLSDWRKCLPLLIAAIVFWAQMLLYSIFFVPICLGRTMLPGMVPFAGFLAVMISSLRPKRLKVLTLILFTALCLFFFKNWVNEEAYNIIEHWEEMAQTLELSSNERDVIIFYPDRLPEMINYYSDVLHRFQRVFTVRIGEEHFEEKIDAGIAAIQTDGKPFNVFLFIRPGHYNIKGRMQTREKLLRYMNSRFGKAALVKRLKNLVLARYEFMPAIDK